ncbi:MAG: histidinol-phosphatase [Oscillospiraceae bacterium]|nr:histidinol-phosphatase [Oscillospiraceae bacterium]
MIANYHSHTTRCGHAKGTEREYVENAIRAGLQILGFSDHTPYDFFDSTPRNRPMRMMPEELPDYAQTIRALALEYREQIEIHCGVEAEYYPRYFSRTLELLRQNGVEYMILGQHSLGNEIGEPYSGRRTTEEAILARYVDQTTEALHTGLFSYFAHPDLIRYEGEDPIYEKHMRRLCRAAKETNTPLEINLLGLWEGIHYPGERFFRIAAEEGNPVILGRDAHEPEAFFDMESEERALEMVKKYGLPLLETVPLRPI